MPRAPTLLFLHGFMGNARDWKPVMRHLEKKFRCVALNLPRQRLPVTKEAVLVGYSMGGRMALRLALRKKCRALVLVSASPGVESARARKFRRTQDDAWAQKLLRERPADFLRAWYAQPVFAGLTKQPHRSLKNRRALARLLHTYSPGRQPSHWKKLRNLQMPVLVVTGRADRKYGKIGRRMARLCPHGSHVIVARSSHMVHVDQPRRLAQEIRQFMNEVTV